MCQVTGSELNAGSDLPLGEVSSNRWTLLPFWQLIVVLIQHSDVHRGNTMFSTPNIDEIHGELPRQKAQKQGRLNSFHPLITPGGFPLDHFVTTM